ncbi:hypothetical protein [Micromonospora lupini]|uniref:Uncharacterized protein n=1 Tax=Micromonospora lupini str. Lupac 08 TaxID=1150864 RepID=I0L473_9ACTN|nr:hypothetical protein [Micromonospora lupini]CCH18620.1 hypothetical protein MILUP08_43531 [Micromonospora lupini str. Lupac 08]
MGSGIRAALVGALYIGALTSALTDKLGSAGMLSSGGTELDPEQVARWPRRCARRGRRP